MVMKRSKVLELIKRLDQADEEPAAKCVEGKEHKYTAVSHADGKDFYAWYYECEHCKHLMVRKNKRKENEMW